MPRGSLHRGAAWEAWLRGRLGQVELADQVRHLIGWARSDEAFHWLSKISLLGKASHWLSKISLSVEASYWLSKIRWGISFVMQDQLRHRIGWARSGEAPYWLNKIRWGITLAERSVVKIRWGILLVEQDQVRHLIGVQDNVRYFIGWARSSEEADWWRKKIRSLVDKD